MKYHSSENFFNKKDQKYASKPLPTKPHWQFLLLQSSLWWNHLAMSWSWRTRCSHCNCCRLGDIWDHGSRPNLGQIDFCSNDWHCSQWCTLLAGVYNSSSLLYSLILAEQNTIVMVAVQASSSSFHCTNLHRRCRYRCLSTCPIAKKKEKKN